MDDDNEAVADDDVVVAAVVVMVLSAGAGAVLRDPLDVRFIRPPFLFGFRKWPTILVASCPGCGSKQWSTHSAVKGE